MKNGTDSPSPVKQEIAVAVQEDGTRELEDGTRELGEVDD